MQISSDHSILEAAPASGTRLSREHQCPENRRELSLCGIGTFSRSVTCLSMYWKYWTLGRRITPGLHLRIMGGERSSTCRSWAGWRELALNAASGRRSPGYTGVCLDTSTSPRRNCPHPRARTSATFACLGAFRSRTSLHNVCAGGTALRASVSSALGDTTALSVGLVILTARPIQPSYEPRRAHLRRAHHHAHPHSRIPCRSGATRSLAGVTPSLDVVVLEVATCLIMHKH